MTKPRLSALEFLLQLDVIGELLPKIGKDQWQALYLSADDPPHRFGMWCALLDDDAAARAIGHDSWDLMIGDGKPGCSQLGVDPTRRPDAVRRFLEEATAALCALRLHYCGERGGAG
jgi:hypothetical protein